MQKRKKRICASIALVFALMLVLTIVIAAIPVCAYFDEDAAPIHTERQERLHQLAEYARALGEPEDSTIIRMLQEEWEKEQQDLDIMAKVVDNEAPNCPWLHRVSVGKVVYNRKNSPYFPNTIFDVVNQSSRWTDENGVVHTVYQYSPEYTRNFEKTSRSAYIIAKYVLDGKATCVPDDIIWQAEFPQGKEVWWASYVDTGYFHSTTYFCRGVYGE